MKNYNKILEAVNRGIKFALSDLEDDEELSSIGLQKQGQIINNNSTKALLELKKEIVDLGLPSGTLWCKYNLGVKPNQLLTPEDWYGDYYAWGEIEPKPKNISKTSWTNYKFCKALDQQNRPIFTKYITKYKDAHGCAIIYADNLTHLLPEDDAAYQNKKIGNYKFSIPTVAQLEELTDNLESKQVNNYNNINGLNGTIYKSENGNEIFFPYAGIINNTGKEWEGRAAFILSNKIASLNLQPMCMEISGNQFGTNDGIVNRSINRYEAFSIRPVLLKK